MIGGVGEDAFELDAGEVCLDFANTLSASSGEHLNSYADLVAFAAQSHLLTPEDAAWLQAEGVRDRVSAEGVLLRARRLRSAIASIFGALAQQKRPREHDVEQVNFELAATLHHARVLPSADGKGGYEWGWSGRNPDAPLWGITRSAADLLVNEQRRQLVRQCGASDCDWLFLDTTKNRSRQWCSMRSCGNREKARRHYQRLRLRSESTPESNSQRERAKSR
jgi:predicted RNA-binding Zn ribbon-like protein